MNWAALKSGIVQRVHTYLAPKLLGGEAAKTPVEGTGFASPQDAVFLRNSKMRKIGEDFFVESEVENRVYRNC